MYTNNKSVAKKNHMFLGIFVCILHVLKNISLYFGCYGLNTKK